jgi:AraC-like DNA-binding protein
MGRCWPQNISRSFAPDFRGSDLYIHAVGYDDFTDPALPHIRHFRSYTAYTVHFVLSGKGTLYVGGKSHSIEAGSLFFTPINQPMAYFPDEEDPWEYIFMNFAGEQALQFCRNMGLSVEHPVRRDIPHVAIRQLLEQMIRSARDEEREPYYRAIAAFYELVHLCGSRPSPKGAPHARYLIDTNYTSPDFTIERLCRDLHISHAHLCRLFKAAYGTSAIRYLIDRRLEQACRLLIDSDLTVREVAYSCGFSDELHFMKTFKASRGVTAGEYRRTR